MDNGRNGFIVADAPDQKCHHTVFSFRDKSKRVGIAEALVEPVLHCRFGVGSQPHIRTSSGFVVVEPCALNLSQIPTSPFTNSYFHCEFQNKLR
jgi:hypothetical protein